MTGSRRGKRYDTEPKLNMKKVFAVILAILVIVMFVYIIKGFFGKGDEEEKEIVSKTYFTAFKDNKWGVLDSNSNIVIDPSYQEMILIPNPKIDVFLCTYDVDYNTGKYKTKVLNSKNQEIFLGYDNVEAIANKDSSNNLWYEDNVLKVEKNKKYGLVNLEGKEVLGFEYDEIVPVLGIKNALKIKKDNKYGIVSNDGTIIVEPKYQDISIIGKENKSGYIIKENNLFGLIDYSSNKVLDVKYDEISSVYGNNMYVVKENKNKKLINKEGKDVLISGFDDIVQILKDKENGVVFKKNNKFGIMSLDGKVILNPEYEDLIESKTGILVAKKSGKYGIIDLKGNKKVDFIYANIQYEDKSDIYIADKENFESDILDSNYEIKINGMLLDCNLEKGYLKLIINDEIKYFNFKFEEKKETDILTDNTLFISKKDGKYGFVGKEGKVIVEYIYDEVTEQNQYGYAGIKKDGKWGSIDCNGKIIQEPIYDLENYLIVDFIGRWHLGQDINMNYYNQL